jgi:hypothetical protein
MAGMPKGKVSRFSSYSLIFLIFSAKIRLFWGK